MTYLDFQRLSAIDPRQFQQEQPYPWINPEGLLTTEGHEELVATLPDVSLFQQRFGVARAHGQQSHDRLTLAYRDDLPLASPWKKFLAELHGQEYRSFLLRLFGINSLALNFHWHYTPNGCSVSPHCDAKHKLGSHIFYLNTNENWDPGWGGETLILDDGGRFDRKSAPDFQDFDLTISAQALGNYSLLFGRKNNSWHGVRPINCPEKLLRKVFIVVINRNNWGDRIKRIYRNKTSTY